MDKARLPDWWNSGFTVEDEDEDENDMPDRAIELRPQTEDDWSMGIRALSEQEPRTSGVEAGPQLEDDWIRALLEQEPRPPQPDFLTAMGRTSGVEAGRSKARPDWSCAKKLYRSSYMPADERDDALEGDSVSDTFKRSNFEYMIVTNSHGGPTETGINERLRRPLFTTQQNVIFPVRCGMPLDITRLPEHIVELSKNLPMSQMEFTGQNLVDALNNCDFTRGISQYDIGDSVPNLEIFTSGEYSGYRGDAMDCDAIDDDVLLYDAVKHAFTSLKDYMEQLVDKVTPILKVTPYTSLRPYRPHISKKNREKNDKVKSTITKKVENQVPFYSLSKTHKTIHEHPDDTPLTLADLCENRGLIEKLVTMLKKDGIIDAKAEASNIPVLVLACRCIPGNDTTFAMGSPTSSNYNTSVGSQKSNSSMLHDLDDDVTGQNARCAAVGACKGVEPNVVDVPDDELDLVGPSIDEGGFGVFGVFGEDLDGGRNATKKRRNRRNATKKRRKRRNATKKRRNRRNATQTRRS